MQQPALGRCRLSGMRPEELDSLLGGGSGGGSSAFPEAHPVLWEIQPGRTRLFLWEALGFFAPLG